MNLGLASLYTTTWILVEHKSTRKAVLQSFREGSHWVLTGALLHLFLLCAQVWAGTDPVLVNFRLQGWFWNMHLNSCDPCFFYSWFSCILAGCYFSCFPAFFVNGKIKNPVFIIGKQIFIKTYNMLNDFFPQKMLLAKCQIKVFEHFRHRDFKILPYQWTYKGQKFFIRILILNNLCLEFNIVDFFFV